MNETITKISRPVSTITLSQTLELNDLIRIYKHFCIRKFGMQTFPAFEAVLKYFYGEKVNLPEWIVQDFSRSNVDVTTNGKDFTLTQTNRKGTFTLTVRNGHYWVVVTTQPSKLRYWLW
jgi:hypothetical protein